MISVFSTTWFKKYNKQITWLARLPFIGEWIFNFKKFGHYIDRKKIVEVQPNYVKVDAGLQYFKSSELLKTQSENPEVNRLDRRIAKKLLRKIERGVVKDKEHLLPSLQNHYFVRNEYALRLQKVFYPIWITFHVWDIITKPIPQLNLGFDTLTKYPYPVDATANTCDGFSGRNGVEETFSTIRAGAGTTCASGGYGCYCDITATGTSDRYSVMRRGRVGFDISTIAAGATISDVNLGFRGTKDQVLGTPSLHICAITPASNTSAGNGDYEQYGSVSFGSLAYANLSASTITDITLNESGIANANKGGIWNLGMRLSWDMLNDTTGLTWSNAGHSSMSPYSAENGESYSPKLVVTYTTSVAYTIEPTVGEFDLTGVNSAITKGLNLFTEVGEFILTGIDIITIKGKGIICGAGDFILTGISSNIHRPITNMITSVGAFALTGIDVVITKTKTLFAGTGNFILTGINIIISGLGNWKWSNQIKNISSWIIQSKNNSSWTQQSKNSTNWTNQTKN